MSDAKNHMELWQAVEKTDPRMTKHVKQRGGFTAICAQYQKKTATQQWGPYGTAWGLKHLKWGCMHSPDNTILELTLDAVFYYPGGEFEISSEITYKPGNDSRKKLRTDVLTKALSDLGFNSDVFEGKFDDNKYVQDLLREHGSPPKPPPRKEHPVAVDLETLTQEQFFALPVGTQRRHFVSATLRQKVTLRAWTLNRCDTIEKLYKAAQKVHTDGYDDTDRDRLLNDAARYAGELLAGREELATSGKVTEAELQVFGKHLDGMGETVFGAERIAPLLDRLQALLVLI